MRGKLLPAASRPRLKAASTKKRFRTSRKVFVFNLPRTFAIVRLFPIFFLDSTRKRVTRALTNSSGSLFVRVVSSPHFETTLFEYGLQCVSVRLVRRGSKPPRHCAEPIAVLMGTATTDSVRKCSAMSALGQKRKSPASRNQLVSGGEQRRWNGHPERFCRFQISDQFVLCRCLHWQVSRCCS
jgi:hypothetical protein